MADTFRIKSVPVLISVLLSAVLFLGSLPAWADFELHTITLEGETEIDIRVFTAQGDTLLLGFPCDQGTGYAEVKAAEAIAQAGIEVWMADLLGAHFLPITPSSMRKLDGQEVSALIDYAHQKTGKQVVLITAGYGAIPVLRGARLWRKRQGDKPAPYLNGAILFYPMLSEKTPEPGKMMEYLPVTYETSLPLFIYQPAKAPNRFWLKRLTRALEQGGSQVSSEILDGVRNRFYKRPDATEQEIRLSERLGELVIRAIDHLQSNPKGTP